MRSRLLSLLLCCASVLTASNAAAADKVYRGFTVNRNIISPLGIAAARQEWNANVLQVQLTNTAAAQQSPAEYLAWLDQAIAELDTIIATIGQQGIKVVINLHSPPGGYVDETAATPVMRIFTDVAAQNALIETWRRLAAHYKSNTTVWAYQLLSEPAPPKKVAKGILNLEKLINKLTTVIRKEQRDTKHLLFVQPPYANPDLLSSKFVNAVADTNIKARKAVLGISVHFYPSLRYQQQGLYSNPYPIAYPGKKVLQTKAKRVYKAQAKYLILPNKKKGKIKKKSGWFPVYIGEFAVARWAPGADLFLKDATDIFNGYGWHATYHIFRDSFPYVHCTEATPGDISYPGSDLFREPWDLELGNDPASNACSPVLTPNGAAIKAYLSKNK